MFRSTCSEDQKCFFGGVVAPPVSLSKIELYGISEYWFSVEDVLSLGGQYNHDDFELKAKSFCNQDWQLIKVFNLLIFILQFICLEKCFIKIIPKSK